MPSSASGVTLHVDISRRRDADGSADGHVFPVSTYPIGRVNGRDAMDRARAKVAAGCR